MNTQTAIVMIVALVVVGALLWAVMNQRRSRSLRDRFGPEYEREILESGNRRRAEEQLAQRVKRVDRLHLRGLQPVERSRFSKRWIEQQSQFVDDPETAVSEADVLVGEVMQRRGYPVGEFDQRAADISVDHPHVVENYRIAHRIAQLLAHGRASTEDLRKAMLHYRALFEELLDDRLAEAR